jgi:gamma-glutamyltranspeptidase/glutathione hydrolase
MAPTIVFQGQQPVLAIGSPGGSMIINYVAKALVGVLDWRLDVQAAIDLPNFGSRNGPTLLELGSRYGALAPELQRRGHQVETLVLTSGLHGIERVPGGWRGGADPRRDGSVRGE